MDATGNFYTTGRQTDLMKKCPVWRISPDGSTRVTVGFIPNQANTPPTSTPCNPSGITFDSLGNLYVADAATINNVSGFIWKVTPDRKGCSSDDSTAAVCSAILGSTASSPTVPYASGVPGANGLAFDDDGNLWTGDGTTGQGRVWKIARGGGTCATTPPLGCVEAFRIQPMRNGTALGGDISVIDTSAEPTQGVGRQARTFPHTAAGGNPQDLVANGIAFDHEGNMFVADTARGAIWLVEFDRGGDIKSKMGCDETFTANTLCLSNIFVAHPFLEGADGIALDRAENIWVDANERNAVAVVSRKGDVSEVFRNPVQSSGLRNIGPLELPTSPFLHGKEFCTANSDGNRRDNFPNSAGEINSGGPVGARGKISCMDQELKIPGLPLPVR
jgi:hypothetical protein